jgi:hypothetical protein
MKVSIILNDMDRTFYSAYGFRSWLTQDFNEPYEVIINIFNDKEDYYKLLCKDPNINANIQINVYDKPVFFNISAANNLGINRSSGDYLIFANSDIIYPTHFLRTLVNELNLRKIAYALASRVNLTARDTDSLFLPEMYDSLNGFNSLVGNEFKGKSISISLWCVLRSIAEEVGGFDPSVLCHEDSDFSDRTMHYLRRKSLQNCLYVAHDLYGYHMHHEPSELYDASIYSKKIIEPRRLRLNSDPNSSEDVVSINLNNIDFLKASMNETSIPPVLFRKNGRYKKFISKILSFMK